MTTVEPRIARSSATVRRGRWVTSTLTFLTFTSSGLLSGCASAVHVPVGAPPTPSTVTSAEPGGDAQDPHEAALLRQLHEGWGWQSDKDDQLHVPMVDWKNYERVRYWAIDHFVGFKYGTDYHVLNVVLIQDVPADTKMDSETCLRRADKWGYPQLKAFEVKLSPVHVSESQWQGKTVLVESVDGYVDFGLTRHEFSAAYAAYPAYPDACLIFGLAVPWRKHAELAQQVRDRWIKEGVPQLRLLTKTKPTRK
jgi:hypothetical protein